MMGFATIDVDSKNTVTVWLTARLGTTQAVIKAGGTVLGK